MRLTPDGLSGYERVASVGTTDDNDDNDDSNIHESSAVEEQGDGLLRSGRDSVSATEQQQQGVTTTTTTAFGFAGLLNNVPYVIMLACAKTISEGGVAAVYIANILPGLAVKLSAPYWFDHVSYAVRLDVAAAAMAMAFLTTGYFSYGGGDTNSLDKSAVVLLGQLLGVAFISFQCGLGEASLLALAGKVDRQPAANGRSGGGMASTGTSKGKCLTAFSSGTGLAGPAGYLWKIAFTEWWGWSVTATLVTASVVLAVSYAWVCRGLVEAALAHPSTMPETFRRIRTTEDCIDTDGEGQELVATNERRPATLPNKSDDIANTQNTHCIPPEPFSTSTQQLTHAVRPVQDMTAAERFHLIRTLCWPYMVPLFLVYAAEYACQAGAWTAIGFPVTDKRERSRFYEQANWLYQAGVFVSRSSGTLVTVSMAGLWLMPVLQVINLVAFTVTAASGTSMAHTILYSKFILWSASLFTGLLGGAVYVHGYQRIVADVPSQYTEFALSSTSLAEGLGVLVADVIGLFLQSCLYRKNGIPGALVECPI